MDKDRLIEALTRKGNLCFPANERMSAILQEPLTGLKSVTQDGSTLWFEGEKPTPATIRIKVYPTGHVVFYNTFGRRFLMTDPEGNPLHEAEWEADEATTKSNSSRCGASSIANSGSASNPAPKNSPLTSASRVSQIGRK